MRVSNRRAFVFALAITVVFGARASAHRLDEYLQAARIGVGPDAVDVELDVTPGADVAASCIATIDRDQDGAFSPAEQRDYAGRIVSALAMALDGAPIALQVTSSTFPGPSALRRGDGQIRLRLRAALPGVPAGSHRLFFRNAYLSSQSALLANALVPNNARVSVTGQRRDRDQSTLTIEYTIGHAIVGAPLLAGLALAASLMAPLWRRLRDSARTFG